MSDVGLLVGDRLVPTAAEEIVRGLLEAVGHAVTYETSTATGLAAWATARDLVVVTGSAATSSATQLRTSASKVVVFSAGGGGGARWSVWGIAGALSSVSNDSWGPLPGVSGQAIVGGRSSDDDFPVWSSGAGTSHFALASTLPAGAVPLYQVGTGVDPKVTGLHVPAGTTLNGGGTAGPRYGLAGSGDSVQLYSGPPAEWRDVFMDLVAHALPATEPPPAPGPDVSIASPGTLTVGGPAVVFDATVALNGGGAVTYAWTFPTGLTPSSTTVQDPSVTATVAGTYEVSLTVTNPQGSDTATISVGAAAVDVPSEGRIRWDGAAFTPLETRARYLGSGQWLNLETGLTFTNWTTEFP